LRSSPAPSATAALAATKSVGVTKSGTKFKFNPRPDHQEGRHREVVVERQRAAQRLRPGFKSKTAAK
jgi:hypothetical protein